MPEGDDIYWMSWSVQLIVQWLLWSRFYLEGINIWEKILNIVTIPTSQSTCISPHLWSLIFKSYAFQIPDLPANHSLLPRIPYTALS